MSRVRTSKLKRRERRYGYLFVAPWLIGAVLLVLLPLVQSFYYGLCSVKIKPTGREFTLIGFKNYINLFLEDTSFTLDLLDYFLNTLISVPVIIVFALAIALLLNQKVKGKGVFRTIFFLPVIVVSGPVMTMLTEEGAATISTMDVATVTSVLNSVIPSARLAETIAGVFGNMILILWYSGVQILIFLAVLQKIDGSLYEAAKIDGGSAWECFWKITLPTIKPMMLLNALYTVIFISSNEGNSIITLIYDAMFDVNKGYGYASAMAWMYALIVGIIVILVAVILSPKRDAYSRQIKKYKKEAKKTARLQAKLERRAKKLWKTQKN